MVRGETSPLHSITYVYGKYKTHLPLRVPKSYSNLFLIDDCVLPLRISNYMELMWLFHIQKIHYLVAGTEPLGYLPLWFMGPGLFSMAGETAI